MRLLGIFDHRGIQIAFLLEALWAFWDYFDHPMAIVAVLQCLCGACERAWPPRRHWLDLPHGRDQGR